MGNIYSYRHDRVGMDGESGSGSGSEGKNTGLGAELDGGGARNPKREDAGRDGPPGLTSLRVSRGGGEAQAPSMPSMPSPASSPASTPAPSPAPSTSSSQEESFFGWRRKSEEQGGDGAVAGQSGAFSDPGWSFGGHGGADGDGDGRLSLAETIPLEETFPEMRLEDGASGGKLRGAGYDCRIDDVSSQVPQGHDTPMVPNLGSSSGTRSVGSGGSRSMQSQEGKESHHRGSLEGGNIGDDRYGMQRRASGTSARGSLTLERANACANRSSFDAFQKALEDQAGAHQRRLAYHEEERLRGESNVFRDSQNVQDYQEYPKDVEFLMALGVPKQLCRDAWMLTVLPPQSPAPAHMLSKLWGHSIEESHACMTALADLGVMCVAQLGGQLWGLPRERFLQQLQLHLLQERPIVSFHRCLVNGYAREVWTKRASLSKLGAGEELDSTDGGQEGLEPESEEPHYLIHDGQKLAFLLMDVEDDGYIVNNLVYHLVGARLHGVVRRLLLNPAWLERKVMLSRSASSLDASLIFADFRSYLMLYSDNDVKLVLEALQLSMAALKQCPVPGLLQTQVTGRLIAAPLIVREPWMQVKYHASSKSMEMRASSRKESIMALPVLNPCLDQAGGVQRSCLKCGHCRPPSRGSGCSESSVASASSASSASSGAKSDIVSNISISGYVGVSHVVVLPTTNGAMEAVSAASDGSLTLWDLEIGDSINVLWAHRAPVTGLAVTSDGSLVVSASSDGMIRAYSLDRGSLLRSFGSPKNPVVHMVLDPHGRFVVTANQHGELVTWDMVSASAVHTHQTKSNVTCLVLSPCAEYAVAGTQDGEIVGVSVETGATAFLLKGHTSAVTRIIAASECKRIFSASHDRDLRAWYRVRSSGSPPMSDVMTNSGSVVSMHLTRNHRTALCGMDTGNIAVWDIATKTCMAVLEGGHAGPVTCVTMSYDENTVLTAGFDGTTIVWTISGGFIRALEGHSGAITSLSTLSRNGFAITGSEDGSVRLWDTKACESHTACWHSGVVRALTCGGSGIVVTVGDDCVARVWNAGLGEHLRSYLKHKSSIRWCFQSTDGYRILTASPDRQISVWDPRSGNMLYGVAAKSGSRVKSLSASADLTMAVSCLFDSTVECWDIVSGRVVWVIQRAGQMTGHESAVNDVQMSADGQLIVTASKDCTARIWNTSSRQCKHVLVGHEDSVIGMVVEQASRTLVTYSLDHSLIVWDLDSGKRISRAKFKSPISRIAMSINGRIAVALSNACINLIDLHSGDIQEVPSLHNGDITDLAFSKDGNYLISSSWDCSIKVIDLTRGCVRGIAMLDSPITCFALDNMHLVAGMDRGTVAFIDVGGIMQGDGN